MAGKQKKTAKRIKKEDYWVRLQKSVGDYKNVLFIDANNVSSLQVLKIRAKLRTIGAVMIMGKNVSECFIGGLNWRDGMIILTLWFNELLILDFDESRT